MFCVEGLRQIGHYLDELPRRKTGSPPESPINLRDVSPSELLGRFEHYNPRSRSWAARALISFLVTTLTPALSRPTTTNEAAIAVTLATVGGAVMMAISIWKMTDHEHTTINILNEAHRRGFPIKGPILPSFRYFGIPTNPD